MRILGVIGNQNKPPHHSFPLRTYSRNLHSRHASSLDLHLQYQYFLLF
jgi:hypothetical protein